MKEVNVYKTKKANKQAKPKKKTEIKVAKYNNSSNSTVGGSVGTNSNSSNNSTALALSGSYSSLIPEFAVSFELIPSEWRAPEIHVVQVGSELFYLQEQGNYLSGIPLKENCHRVQEIVDSCCYYWSMVYPSFPIRTNIIRELGLRKVEIAIYNFLVFTVMHHEIISPKVFMGRNLCSFVQGQVSQGEEAEIDFSSLKEMEKVDLSACSSEIDFSQINQFHNVISLDLSFCRLASVSSLECVEKLKKLNLSNNEQKKQKSWKNSRTG